MSECLLNWSLRYGGLLNSSGTPSTMLLAKSGTGRPQATATARILQQQRQVRQVRPENHN